MLPAAQRREVYVVDGPAYFSRSGPRIVDSLEILAETLHPELFRGRFPDRGVVRRMIGCTPRHGVTALRVLP